MVATIRRILSRAVISVLSVIAPARFKHWMELRYWRRQHRLEGELKNAHYEYFFTTFFGLSREDYRGKCVLDIGCGPRGSLEWVSADAECVGIDPLVPQYQALGISQHRMRYVQAGVEEIPFQAGHFQMVTSFNNLDHVDDVQKAVSEIKRVTAPGGTFLLITEVEHAPSATEPQSLPRSVASWFEPEFEILTQGICAIRDDHNVYLSVRENNTFKQGDEGIVFARFLRR